MDELLNTAPCGFLSLAPDGTILLVNETLATWLDSTPPQLQGSSIKSILSMGGRVFYETHFWPQLKLQGQIEEIYFSLRSSAGEAVPVLVNAARRERGGENFYDCIFFRRRQRDQYENELILARKAAEQANQAKAAFLSVMSHELRTPLSAIAGFTQLIASGADGPLTPAQEEDLSCIQRGTEDLLRLVNDILNFAHMEREGVEIKWEVVDVEEAILRAHSLMQFRFDEAGLRCQIEKSPSKVMVRVDSGRFQQILLNLLSNAIKFTPHDGTIVLAYSLRERHVLIEVRDTGCGIADDQIERIFEPFVQINRLEVELKQRGIGLGLAICRQLARAVNGELTVSSVLGQGSVFTLTFPTYESS